MVAKIRTLTPRYIYRLCSPETDSEWRLGTSKPQLPEGNNYRTESPTGPHVYWRPLWPIWLADCMMTMLKMLIKGTSEIKAFHNCSKSESSPRSGLEFREIEISFSIRPAIYQMLLSIVGFWSSFRSSINVVLNVFLRSNLGAKPMIFGWM